ncbi:hypothetical protein ACFXP3_02760 [Streptomyces sp. NPDC059096]|uniref:hypothetical protein n=1 Tax=Streptomyces sp. NPDC059096 TaxID=3346727 RepID=UPI0036B55088
MPTSSDARITLFSSSTGISAFAQGEQYLWAKTALEISGFQHRNDGTYFLPANNPEDTRTAVADLLPAAERHQTTVITSTRRFLGDIADDLAARLPGAWSATLSVHSHPLWQEDLVPWVWDSGELMKAVQQAQVPYAATLNNGAGIELLLIERPGHPTQYVVGALTTEDFHDSSGEPEAPHSLVATESDLAAGITERFLPAYQQALHTRRSAAVAAVLDRIRVEYDAWKVLVASRRYNDVSPIAIDALGVQTKVFLDNAWDNYFLTVLQHGPALLAPDAPGAALPENAAVVARLAGALADAEAVQEELGRDTDTPLARQKFNARMWPAVEIWLADGDTLLSTNPLAASRRQSALPSGPPRGLPPGRPAHRR